MEKTEMQALAQKMIDAVRGFVAKAEEALNGRIDAIEARIAAIPKGDQGAPGPAGKDGADGRPGPTGEAGPPGKDGMNGKDGAPGPAGKDGADGRDAAELDILPSIDEAKSYRRGTWASHNGGMVRAGRQTDAVRDGDIIDAGWVVMVEGLVGVVVTQSDDPREIEVAAMLTSGAKAISRFHIPMVIDRGVWREGEHAKGDHVTWDGSGWIAQTTTTDKPGTSSAWRLSTKRGRDGKDGGSGAPKPPSVVRTA
jgi:hypothetical protein